jgi:hypothetical protein
VLVVLADATSYSIDLTARETEMASRTVENDELARLLSNSKYLGFLSESGFNPELAKCANFDGVNCDADKSYPLTLVSTATNQPMVSASGILDNNATNVITFKVSCAGRAITCDKAQWFVVNIKTTEKPGLNLHRMVKTRIVEKSVVVQADIERHHDFIPDNQIAPGRPINVILFIDTSNSMYTIRDKVNITVSSLIDRLSKLNMDVNVKVQAIDGLVRSPNKTFYTDVNGVIAYLPSSNGYVPDNVAKDSIFWQKEIIDIYRNLDGVTHSLLSGDSTTTKALKVADLQLDVKSIQRLVPSGVDSALCQMLLAVEMKKFGGQYQLELSRQIPTVVFMITNEDDDSTMNLSLSDQLSYLSSGFGTLCAQAVDSKSYLRVTDVVSVAHLTPSYSIGYIGILDGAPAPMYSSLFLPPMLRSDYPAGAKMNAVCPVDMTVLNTYCAANPLATGCPILGQAQTITCNYGQSNVDSQSVPTLKGINCATDELLLIAQDPYYYLKSCNSATYTNAQFVVNPIETKVIPLVSNNTQAHTNDDVVAALEGSIKDNIGLENFYFMPVIHSSTDSCAMEAGARRGSKYERLANELGDKQSTITPICAADYSAGLDKIETFVKTFAVGDFVLTPAMISSFRGVVVLKKNGTTTQPTANVEYRIIGSNLIFSAKYIEADDIVRVYY